MEADIIVNLSNWLYTVSNKHPQATTNNIFNIY